METRPDRPAPDVGREDNTAPPRILGTGAAVLALLLVAGCASDEEVAATQASTANTGCPRVTIVPEAQQVTVFRDGPGRDLTDVVSRAGIADYTGSCEYEGDDRAVTVYLNLALAAERGPAMTGDEASYTYFVAVTAPDGRIIAKEEFDAGLAFPTNAPVTGSMEQLEQRIPLPPGGDGRAYGILVGMQLTPEQIEYNRNGGRL